MRKVGLICLALLLLAGCQRKLEGAITTSGNYERLDGMVVSIRENDFTFTDEQGVMYKMEYDGELSQNDEVAVVYHGNTSTNSNINPITGILGYNDTSKLSMYLNVIDEIVLYDEIGANINMIVLDFDSKITLSEGQKTMISAVLRKRYSVNSVIFDTYENTIASSKMNDGIFTNGAIFQIKLDEDQEDEFTLTKYHENLQHVAFGVKFSGSDNTDYSYQITSATSNVESSEALASESDTEESKGEE